MGAQGRRVEGGPETEAGAANVVRLRGRVTTGPAGRRLPSGTEIVTLRISVPREQTAMTRGSRQTRDWVDCTAWSAAARRSASRWREGDEVEVEGALRRRVQRVGGAGPSSRLEVEVLSGRVVARSPARKG